MKLRFIPKFKKWTFPTVSTGLFTRELRTFGSKLRFCLSADRAGRRLGFRFCQVMRTLRVRRFAQTFGLNIPTQNLRHILSTLQMLRICLFGPPKLSDAAQAAAIRPERYAQCQFGVTGHISKDPRTNKMPCILF
jgi:hypothetical protein